MKIMTIKKNDNNNDNNYDNNRQPQQQQQKQTPIIEAFIPVEGMECKKI